MTGNLLFIEGDPELILPAFNMPEKIHPKYTSLDIMSFILSKGLSCDVISGLSKGIKHQIRNHSQGICCLQAVLLLSYMAPLELSKWLL
jgi:hypothetical protein